MSNKLPVLTELPIISSKIQIDTEILSTQSAEFEKARKEITNSSKPVIQMGSGIPERKRTNTRTSTSTTTMSTTDITEFSSLNYLKLIGVIGFLVLAGGAYWFFLFYSSSRKN